LIWKNKKYFGKFKRIKKLLTQLMERGLMDMDMDRAKLLRVEDKAMLHSGIPDNKHLRSLYNRFKRKLNLTAGLLHLAMLIPQKIEFLLPGMIMEISNFLI
jgi:hypothetical protein